MKNDNKTLKTTSINNLLKKELICSMGCTEPSAIAFAVAYAKEHVPSHEEVKKINFKASSNILKNALCVNLPNTNINGIRMIILLGLLNCNSKNKLTILNNITLSDIDQAIEFEKKIKIKIELKENVDPLYIEVELITENHKVVSIVEKKHDEIKCCYVDDKLLFDNRKELKEEESFDNLTFNDVYDFIIKKQYNVSLMERVKKYNYEISNYGMNHEVGLNIGKSIVDLNIYDDKIKNIIAVTTSGIDSRMSGVAKKVIINSGSGNQGITATIPIVEYAKENHIDKETELQALAMSHLVTLYIRSKQHKLSSSCGIICASCGVAAGISFMLGCNKKQIEGAINNLLCSNFGVFCDGAKVTCALKCASAVSSAINSAFLAKNNVFVNENYGVISPSLEKTLLSLKNIESEFTSKLDKIIMNEAIKNRN